MSLPARAAARRLRPLRPCSSCAFSTTARALVVTGPLPTFPVTSNPDLDALLDQIRADAFVPSHLSGQHRNLIRRPRNHHILNEDPLELTVGGQPVVLTPSVAKSVPIISITRAVRLMHEPSDLDVLPDLVRGFASMKRKCSESQMEMISRKVAAAGRTSILMALARDAREMESGFKLTPVVAREFVRGFRVAGKAAASKKDAAKLLKELERLRNVFGEAQAKLRSADKLRRDTVVIGTTLDVFVEKAQRWDAGRDVSGAVERYVEKLRENWILQMPDLVEGKKQAVWDAKNRLRDYVPVLEGVRGAGKILDEGWLEAAARELEDIVEALTAFLTKLGRMRMPGPGEAVEELGGSGENAGTKKGEVVA